MPLSLGDLSIEAVKIDDWTTEPPLPSLESFELINHEPWDDAVSFDQVGLAAPTRRAIASIRQYLDTDADWKVWARLRSSAKNTIALPRTLSHPVSYTHLDVYKRQSVWPEVVQVQGVRGIEH